MYTNNSNLFEKAQGYSLLGFSLLPTHSVVNGNCTCGKTDCKSIAKHPLTKNGVKDASREEAKLKQHFTGNLANANIAIATGEPSGVLILDVDSLDSLAELEKNNEPLPKTWKVKTGSGGLHIYFKHVPGLKNAVKFAGSLDIRTTGGYCLLPPSKHASGNHYEWIIKPDEIELAVAPEWLLSLIPKQGEALTIQAPRAKTEIERASLYLNETPPAVSGSKGSDHTLSVVCRLLELFKTLSDDEIIKTLDDWNSTCIPPWTEGELRHKLEGAKERVNGKVAVPVTHNSNPTIQLSDYEHVEKPREWVQIDNGAFYGLAGEVVSAIEPETEADAIGVLMTFLTVFGHAIGNNAYFKVGGGKHHSNLFTCLVGDSAAGKGLSWQLAKYCFPKEYLITSHGLSSGEGLVERVGDDEDSDVSMVLPTKPLLCMESEFSKPITAMRREGNTLSPCLRSAWDCSTLEVMTRGKSKLIANNAYISIVAHITPEELNQILANSMEIYNGFANRFLWTLVRSSKSLPSGGDESVLDPYKNRIKTAIEIARSIGQLKRDAKAEALWSEIYPELKESKPGIYGKAVERGRPYVVRLSMIYALLDSSPIITISHLQAAIAVWRYAEASARIIFSGGQATLTKFEKRVLSLVQAAPGLKRTDINRGVAHASKYKVDSALELLIQRGEVVHVPIYDNRQADTYYPGTGIPKRDSGLVGVGTGVATSQSEPKPTKPTKQDAETDESAIGTDPKPTKPTKQDGETVKAASIVELFEWINPNGVQFEKREKGEAVFYWVTKDKESLLTPAIEAAIWENQVTVSTLVPKLETVQTSPAIQAPNPADETDYPNWTPEQQAFFEELKHLND